MKRFNWASFIAVGLLLFAYPFLVQAQDNKLHLISTDFAGGSLKVVDGRVSGNYADFFREAAARSGVEIDFRIVPWARAIKETEESKTFLIFPFTRSKEREKNFKWVVPIKEDSMCFVSQDGKTNTFEKARNLSRVLVWYRGSHKDYLESLSFGNLATINSAERAAEILTAKPGSAWYYICSDSKSFVDKNRLNNDLKIGIPVASEAIWLASGNAYTESEELKKFTNSIRQLNDEKFLEKLLKKEKN